MEQLYDVIAQRDVRIVELMETIGRQGTKIDQLQTQLSQREAQNAKLEATIVRLKKDSSNSSKPPSSDIVKPQTADDGKKSKRRKRRKRGGQKGHPKQDRPMFAVDAIDQTWDYFFANAKDLAGLEPLDEFEVLQQVELAEKLFTVTEHRARKYRCRVTGRIITAPLPDEVTKAGLVGLRLSAFVAYLKGACHMSYTSVQRLFADVMNLPISRGMLAKVVSKAAAAMEHPYHELQAALPSEPFLNVDETGHKDDGQHMWTWCFRAAEFTLFKISPTRSSQVLEQVLGPRFNGVLGSDYFAAYRKYMAGENGDLPVLVQFCIAHLIRDVKFLTTLPDAATQRYGNRLLDGLRKLFGIIHRRDKLTDRGFRRSLEKTRFKLLRTAGRAPQSREAQNMATRFRKHGRDYFTFITTPGIEPTNNLAEQAIRFVVIDRKVTQGTRGDRGQRWCERIWTVLATCRQQSRSAFEFLEQSLHAYFTGHLPPSLMPAGP